MRSQIPPVAADEAAYAEYGQNMSTIDPHLDTNMQHQSVDVDPNTRKFDQTYGPAQGMRNEYAHIWERPLPQPSNPLSKYPQAI